MRAPRRLCHFCNMGYCNRGGNAPFDESTIGLGSFSWSFATTGPRLIISPVTKNAIASLSHPVENELSLSDLKFNMQLKIFYLDMKLLLAETTPTTTPTFDLSRLASDIYFIILTASSTIIRAKF
ncbi:MAG: hypothetical protein H7199_10740 [Burkholderiales bacterium]|nr:hypothetical protein [Flavobacterium sp.]